MTKAQRSKGQRGEREVAEALRAVWPEARRGLQAQGGERAHTCDVEGTPLWVEVKRYASRVPWRQAWEQAQRETDGRPIVIVARGDRQAWQVQLELATFCGLLGLHVSSETRVNVELDAFVRAIHPGAATHRRRAGVEGCGK